MTFPSAGFYSPQAILGVTGQPATSTPVNVYLTGTLTAASLYTDHTKASAALNPVDTDVLGNLSFYAEPGLYDLAVTVGGVATTLTVLVEEWPADVEAAAGGVVPIISDATTIVGTLPATPAYIVKHRSDVCTVGSGGQCTVAFTTPFPNAIIGLEMCPGDNAASLTSTVITDASVTLAGFTFLAVDNAGVLITTGDLIRANWVATGC